MIERLMRLLGFSSSDTTVLNFDGELLTARGDLMSRGKISEIESELRKNHSGPGTIRLRKDGKIIFSGSIDGSLHQRLRNLLLS